MFRMLQVRNESEFTSVDIDLIGGNDSCRPLDVAAKSGVPGHG
jgi:hypothetical protein